MYHYILICIDIYIYILLYINGYSYILGVQCSGEKNEVSRFVSSFLSPNESHHLDPLRPVRPGCWVSSGRREQKRGESVCELVSNSDAPSIQAHCLRPHSIRPVRPVRTVSSTRLQSMNRSVSLCPRQSVGQSWPVGPALVWTSWGWVVGWVGGAGGGGGDGSGGDGGGGGDGSGGEWV